MLRMTSVAAQVFPFAISAMDMVVSSDAKLPMKELAVSALSEGGRSVAFERKDSSGCKRLCASARSWTLVRQPRHSSYLPSAYAK
jgi:hypothetical protein